MNKMREEFESWYSDFDGYGEAHKKELWDTWKASRAALCVELPSFENGSIRGYSGDCDEARMVVDGVAESLGKSGVSYK